MREAGVAVREADVAAGLKVDAARRFIVTVQSRLLYLSCSRDSSEETTKTATMPQPVHSGGGA